MEQLEVSEIARSKRGFLYNYNIHGKKFLILRLPITDPDYSKGWTWDKKRNAFIDRHLAQYNKEKTVRRKLALIAWAYDPDQ